MAQKCGGGRLGCRQGEGLCTWAAGGGGGHLEAQLHPAHITGNWGASVFIATSSQLASRDPVKFQGPQTLT